MVYTDKFSVLRVKSIHTAVSGLMLLRLVTARGGNCSLKIHSEGESPSAKLKPQSAKIFVYKLWRPN